MAIPETQLETWSHQGAITGSQRTYGSIQAALYAHNWTSRMRLPSVYLQGSYPNHTNIRGDSDVDVVAETNQVFYSNVSAVQLRSAGWPAAQFTWEEFRADVLRALTTCFGTALVSQGNKCINVGGEGNRLNADVVPCFEYKRFSAQLTSHTSGITFWTQSGTQIINYPKQHRNNGSHKNSLCNGNYKPVIRMFKNARNRAGSEFPSYFLECLLYNVPTADYTGSYQTQFHNVLVSLVAAKNSGSMASWRCQNGQQTIFGNEVHQIQLSAAHTFVNSLVGLWNNWS